MNIGFPPAARPLAGATRTRFAGITSEEERNKVKADLLQLATSYVGTMAANDQAQAELATAERAYEAAQRNAELQARLAGTAGRYVDVALAPLKLEFLDMRDAVEQAIAQIEQTLPSGTHRRAIVRKIDDRLEAAKKGPIAKGLL